MTRPGIRIFKLGGSLLDLDDLAPTLRRWLSSQPTGLNVLVTGGGRWADLIREFDARHGIGDEAAHFLCVDVMSLTARLLASLLGQAMLISRLEELLDDHAPDAAQRPVIFDVKHFIRHEEPRQPGTPLPHGWHVTSDSIAARLAQVTKARELVLLKSMAAPQPATVDGAVSSGFVDRYFSIAAGPVPAIRCVDLRRAGWPESRLK